MARTKPEVTVIPAKKTILSAGILSPSKKRRVAAYARVSTDSEEQGSKTASKDFCYQLSYQIQKS